MAESFPFFDLPGELRNMIYDHTLQRQDDRTCCMDIYLETFAKDLVTVSRQFAKEYRESRAKSVSRLTITKTLAKGRSKDAIPCFLGHKQLDLSRLFTTATHLKLNLTAFLFAHIHAHRAWLARLVPHMRGLKQAIDIRVNVRIFNQNKSDALNAIEQIRLELNEITWMRLVCTTTLDVHYAKNEAEFRNFGFDNLYMSLSAETGKVEYCDEGAIAVTRCASAHDSDCHMTA